MILELYVIPIPGRDPVRVHFLGPSWEVAGPRCLAAAFRLAAAVRCRDAAPALDLEAGVVRLHGHADVDSSSRCRFRNWAASGAEFQPLLSAALVGPWMLSQRV